MCCILGSMSDKIDSADPFDAEVARLVAVLAAKVKGEDVSVRSLEKKMGVADSLFNKILKGKITLQVRHVLMICAAAGIEWKDFFSEAYGFSPAPAEESAAGENSVPPVLPAWMEEMMIDLLLRLDLIDTATAARLIREGLSRGRSGAGGNAGAGRDTRGSAPPTEPSPR